MVITSVEEDAAIAAGAVTMGAVDSPGAQRRQVILLETVLAVRYM
jgi:hypothetical protein